MNRKISWNSNEFDEIELVYEKAESDESIGKMLEQLETNALEEAKNNVGLLTTDSGKHLSAEQFDTLSGSDKETVIKVLSGMGLDYFNTDIQSALIQVRFTSKIQKLMACVIFNVINRIEKLDGAINMLHPKWTLELQVPVGGKKGLFQWEMLIMRLYPWISVREVASNEIVEEMKPDTSDNDAKEESVNSKTQKEANDKNSVEFFTEMEKYPSFIQAYERAKNELGNAIKNGKFTLRHQNAPLSHEQWCELAEMEKLNFVLAMGNYGISVKAVICVDFTEIIPNCIAIMLLYGAWSGQLKKQMIDAGDGANVKDFAEALTRLYGCCADWECTIAHPVMIKIGESVVDTPKSSEKIQEKKSFWKKIFGK